MLTRFWQNRYRGLLAALLIGLAGAIVVLLLPSRYNAVARVQVTADDASAIDPARAAAVLNDDQIIARVLRRVDPDLVDPIDPRPIDPLVAFRRHFAIVPAATSGEFDVSYAARSADTARKVSQTWLQAAHEVIDSSSDGSRPGDTTSTRKSAANEEDRSGAVASSPADTARLHDLDAQLVELQPRLDAARTALEAFDARAAREAGQSADNRKARRIRAAQRELDAAIASVGAIEARLAATPATVRQRSEAPGPAPVPAPAARGATEAQLQARVQEAEAALAALRIRYTDSHPDVRRQMSVVADARAARDASRGGAPGNRVADAASPAATVERDVPNPAVREIQRELAAAQRQVASARAKLVEIEAAPAAADTTAANEASPERIQAVTVVTDVELQIQRVKAERDELNRAVTVATRARAESAASTPRNQTLRLAVLSGPEVIPAVTNPDRPLWLWRVLAGSLLTGLIAAMALGTRRTTYHDLRELDRGTRLRSLGAVPRFTTLTRRLGGFARLLGFVMLLLVYVLVFIALVAVVSAGLSWQALDPGSLRQAVLDLVALEAERLGPLVQWLNVKGMTR